MFCTPSVMYWLCLYWLSLYWLSLQWLSSYWLPLYWLSFYWLFLYWFSLQWLSLCWLIFTGRQAVSYRFTGAKTILSRLRRTVTMRRPQDTITPTDRRASSCLWVGCSPFPLSVPGEIVTGPPIVFVRGSLVLHRRSKFLIYLRQHNAYVDRVWSYGRTFVWRSGLSVECIVCGLQVQGCWPHAM